MLKRIALGIAAAALAAASMAASQAAPSPLPSVEADVDRLFAKWTTSTPGCAVGVAVGGRPVLAKAYGMADLEHDVPNRPETVFEAGSLSKQFTAMAILLLMKDGKLSLDDPVRTYVPELPDYGAPLTIRHMLTHTSGLRDWGSIAAVGGWPRTTREYTHAHVLEIVARQKTLNFPPGTQWSYSNTGFNLAAIIVSRVSGLSFAEFSTQRIFAPLGMTHTSWRDDHTRIVKGRAIAYAADGASYRIEMPFENVHGNGGLLTTVGDLLKWNENYVAPIVGDPALLGEQQTPGRYNDGRALDYALGLFVNIHRGMKNVYHSGATAGYRAHLNRFPAAHTSVAVLCNGSTGDATRSANAVSDLYLAGRLQPAAPAAPARPAAPAMAPPPTAEKLAELAGNYWSDEAETMLTAAVDAGKLVLKRRPDTVVTLTPVATDAFRGLIGEVTFRRDANGKVEALSIKQDRVWDLRFTRAR
ncbi:MAG TPA: serine hydrolase domain-containing protein [Vicinamibacterales bacterium]|nr:serine hydrolase domain-containing protein [Vicinamibacterales bacterium]